MLMGDRVARGYPGQIWALLEDSPLRNADWGCYGASDDSVVSSRMIQCTKVCRVCHTSPVRQESLGKYLPLWYESNIKMQ